MSTSTSHLIHAGKPSFLTSIIFAFSILALSFLSSSIASAKTIDFDIDVNTGLEIIVPSTTNLPVAPSADATFASTDLDITVSTNNPTGYTLTMTNSSTELINSTTSATIPTLEDNTAKSNFPTNRWGYSLDDITYNPITTSGTILKATNTNGNADTTTINLATKVDLTTPAGAYTNTFVFNAVANQSIFTVTWNANGGTVSPSSKVYNYGMPLGELPIPTLDGYDFLGWFTQATGGSQISATTIVTADATYYAQWEEKIKTLAEITTMQEMTFKICATTSTPSASDGASTPQYQLKDTRDNKLYWVAKLADGNCWMTQNLDYDIKADGTDIIATIGGGTTTTWKSSYPPHATGTTLSGNTTSTGTYSWDPGDYYVVNGGKGITTACTTWRPTSTCRGTTKLSYDLTNADAKDKEELHYHLGNYYQWNTATAGYGGTEENNKDINYSICPQGWRLPTSNSYTNNYSFGKLTNAYGITNSANGSSDANLIKSPLWFVRAGYVSDGRLLNQGTSGLVLSMRADSSSYTTYFLVFSSSYVYPSSSSYRYHGRSVRCVAE